MKTGRESLRRWPLRDFLADFEPELNQPHAIEELAHKDPTLRRAYRTLRGRSREVQAQVRNEHWAHFADARVLVQTLEFELAFNLGFEQGLLRGRAETLDGQSGRRAHGASARLTTRMQALVSGSGLRPEEALAVVLKHAYALALREPLPSGGNRRSRSRARGAA